LRWAWDLLDWLGAYRSILVWGGTVWATTTVAWVCQREVCGDVGVRRCGVWCQYGPHKN